MIVEEPTQARHIAQDNIEVPEAKEEDQKNVESSIIQNLSSINPLNSLQNHYLSNDGQSFVEPYLQHLKIKLTLHIIYQLIILAVSVTVLGLFSWDLYSKYRREHQLA